MFDALETAVKKFETAVTNQQQATADRDAAQVALQKLVADQNAALQQAQAAATSTQNVLTSAAQATIKAKADVDAQMAAVMGGPAASTGGGGAAAGDATGDAAQ